MRIFLLLLIIGISFSVSFSKRTKNSTATLSPKTTKTNDVTVTNNPATTKTPRDSRGKRTLYDIGTYPYQPIQISRRIGGYSDPRAYYPQEIGYHQPQYAPYPSYIPEPSNHLPPDYHHGYYQQYIEPPEPIIEIIIKESNETLDLPPPQPIVHKKKKERVQVFYVNYKKDKNNKLLLETPIASLEHNKHHDENEEEEIINYPAVTALPPVKTTTLRTVIHPESEQYHSNSGIHVSFGTEDKHQSGHELQEHNEESVIRSVVALPNQNNYIRDQHRTSDQQHHHVSQNSQKYHEEDQRFYEPQPTFQITDLGPSEPINNFNDNHDNQYNKNQYQIQQQSSQPDLPPAQHYVSQHLQLPVSHQNQPFRNFVNQYQVTHTMNNQQKENLKQYNQQPQQYQSQNKNQQHQVQHQQTQSYPPLEIIQKYDPRPRLETQAAKYNVQSESQQEKYVSHPRPDAQQQIKLNEQHYQQRQQQQLQVQQTQPKEQSHNQQEQYHDHPLAQQLARLTPFPTKQTIRFPFQSIATQKQQALPQYQPVKFRPTVTPQTQQHLKQPDEPNYQRQQNFQQQQPRPTQKPFNPFPVFGIPSQNKKKSETKVTSTYNSFNQQQFQFKQPNPSATQTSQSQYSQHQAAPRPQEQYLSDYSSNQGQSGQQNSASFGPLQSLFGGPTQSELVSSVPRFEQHITEFVKSPSEQQSQINANSANNEFSFRNKNQVIQNIPAPKLGPTSPNPFNYQSTPAPQTQNTRGNYIISSTPDYNTYIQQQDQQQKYVSSIPQQQYQSSTPQYIQTNNGQQIQIVTPLPSTQFQNHGQQQQAQLSTSGAQPIIIPNSQPRQQHQTEKNYASTGQSVSTLHTDAFYDLEQKRNEYLVQQAQHQQAQYQQKQEQQNYVSIQARNKYSAESLQDKNQNKIKSTTTPLPSITSTTETPLPTTVKATASKKANLALPDEVPEELRQQLLSSGILDNADISVLDYDKVGDIALENLPPEHLAHFYGNGGGAQIAGSHKVLSVVRPNGEKVNFSEKQIDRVKQTQTLPRKQNVDLKVVRFDSTNQKTVTDKFVKSDSTILPPVNISTEKQYNRYLPLKVSGAQFPIPDADELKGKKISSVVVLAPVDSEQNLSEENQGRQERDAFDSKGIKFVAGDSLKQLIKKPSSENFKKWLEKESKTEIDLQSVVLLVTGASESDKEIFMYDIGTQSINKLSGELSTAFVNVAEENASSEDLENVKITDSGIIERMSSDSLSKEIDDQKNDDQNSASSNLYETIKFDSEIDKTTSSKTTNNEKLSITSNYSSVKK